MLVSVINCVVDELQLSSTSFREFFNFKVNDSRLPLCIPLSIAYLFTTESPRNPKIIVRASDAFLRPTHYPSISLPSLSPLLSRTSTFHALFTFHSRDLVMSTMAVSARSRSKAQCRVFFCTILCLSLLILPSRATKVCQTFQPLKRNQLNMGTTMVAAAATFPRGGGAAKITATTAPPASSTTISPALILKSFLKTIADARSHLAAAAAARAVSIFSMYPVDTIKTRMQMKQGDAFRLSGLYKGCAGSLVGQVPYG